MSALRMTRVLAAPPERVWHAFTDPAALAAWFWPRRLAMTAEVAPRVDGRYRLAGQGPGMAIDGSYVAVEPPSRLAFTWRWQGEPEQTLVTLRLAPGDTGTELTLIHDGFADDTARDDHVKGWSDCLDRLPDWQRDHRTLGA